MADQEKILERVRQLRKLADDAIERGSTHEADTAKGRADELIQRYRLTEAELDDRKEEIVHEHLDRTKTRKPWRDALAFDLAKHYGCTAYHTYGQLPDKTPFHDIRLVGRKADIGFVKAMYAWTRLEIMSLAERHARAEAQESFRCGAVEGLRETLEKARAAAEEAYAAEKGVTVYMNTVMVLARRDEEAENAFLTAWAAYSEKLGVEGKEVKGPPPVKITDVTAFYEGKAKGAQIELEKKKSLGNKANALEGPKEKKA